MEAMNISATTQKLFDKAASEHKNKRVFDASGRVKKTPELDELTRQIAEAMAADIKRHTGSKGKGGASADHLYNYAIIVKYCTTACCCHYGLYDVGGRASYYLGRHCYADCYEA